MTGSWQQESVYIATAAVETIALLFVRRSFGPLALAVRIYLTTQLFAFCFLFPFSLFCGYRTYLYAYCFASILNFLAEMVVIAGLFEELSGWLSHFGPLKIWFLYCLLAGVAAFSALALAPPRSFTHLGRLYLTVDQAFSMFRIGGLFGVFLKGFLCGSSWPYRVSTVWVGMAVYSLADFASQRFELIHSFAFYSLVQYLPAAAAMVMIVLWCCALYVPQRVPSFPIVQHQENIPV